LHFGQLARFFASLGSHGEMVSTRKQKQVLLVENPLRDAGILQQVLKFLPGNWLFLGAVCREWRTIYSRAFAEDQQVRSFSLDEDAMLVACGVTTTLCCSCITCES
jgi:hypothetical protein